MANRGYDVVVDVDAEGDLGHTDLQEDLEFHSSSKFPFFLPVTITFIPCLCSNSFSLDFETPPSRNKLPPSANNPFSAPQPSSSKRLLWTLSFYAQFFDVDTAEVLRRCRTALYPRSNFLDVLDGNPDLYGPFWIATTVIFILFLTATISQYLASQEKDHFQYDFKLLSGAAGLVYGYTGVIPVALWGVLRWFGSEGANVLECWALYGYANLIWIPVALISWSPLTVLNWVFCGVGFGVSAVFLVRNLYPVVSATDQKTSKILVIVVVALHAGFSIAIAILFFAHGSPAAKSNTGEGDDGKTIESILRL